MKKNSLNQKCFKEKIISIFKNELSNNPKSFKEKFNEIIINLFVCIDVGFDNYNLMQEYLNKAEGYFNKSFFTAKRYAQK